MLKLEGMNRLAICMWILLHAETNKKEVLDSQNWESLTEIIPWAPTNNPAGGHGTGQTGSIKLDLIHLCEEAVPTRRYHPHDNQLSWIIKEVTTAW